MVIIGDGVHGLAAYTASNHGITNIAVLTSSTSAAVGRAGTPPSCARTIDA